MLEAGYSRLARPITHFRPFSVNFFCLEKVLGCGWPRCENSCLGAAATLPQGTTAAAAVAFELSSLLVNLILTPTDLG